MKRIAINGFGRIGRILFRILHEKTDYEIVAVNDISSPKVLSHLLKYDSIHGKYHRKISFTDNSIVVDNQKIDVFSIQNLHELPWKKMNVDVVFECTGLLKTFQANMKHIDAGSEKVILSCVPDDTKINMVVLGVNDDIIKQSDSIVSNASCTTNCAAPMIKVLDDAFDVKSAYVTTVHSYTSDQNLHDAVHTDLRRARSAPNSIIPTTTGAAKALSHIFPNIELSGCGIRVPVANCSLIDVTCIINTVTDVKNVNKLFERESRNTFKDIIYYNVDPIVSIDVTSNPYSCVFDSELTYVTGNMVKVVGWYDNEYGYCSRLVDLLLKIS